MKEDLEMAAAEQLEAVVERSTVIPQTADSGSAPTQQLRFFIATITDRKPEVKTSNVRFCSAQYGKTSVSIVVFSIRNIERYRNIQATHFLSAATDVVFGFNVGSN